MGKHDGHGPVDPAATDVTATTEAGADAAASTSETGNTTSTASTSRVMRPDSPHWVPHTGDKV